MKPVVGVASRLERCRLALVDDLIARGVKSPRVLEAFAVIPRHHFIDSVLEPSTSDGGQDWLQARRRDGSDASWPELVYANEALVTVLDEFGEPASSSTAPSVMAGMVEALDVRPGMRVLEVGTGTGYNAAILAHCVGPGGGVVSIENQPALAETAAARLAALFPTTVRVVVGDGLAGVGDNAPYNRIIATASTPWVPAAWLAQLAPGGRILVDLRGPLVGGLLQVDRSDEGGFTGHFLRLGVGFMALRPLGSEAGGHHRLFNELLPRSPSAVTPVPVDFDPLALTRSWDDSGFLRVLQCRLPMAHASEVVTIETGEESPCLIDVGSATLLKFRGGGGAWRAEVRGDNADILGTVLDAHREWVSLGSPGLHDFAWTGRVDGTQAITLPGTAMEWALVEQPAPG